MFNLPRKSLLQDRHVDNFLWRPNWAERIKAGNQQETSEPFSLETDPKKALPPNRRTGKVRVEAWGFGAEHPPNHWPETDRDATPRHKP